MEDDYRTGEFVLSIEAYKEADKIKDQIIKAQLREGESSEFSFNTQLPTRLLIDKLILALVLALPDQKFSVIPSHYKLTATRIR